MNESNWIEWVKRGYLPEAAMHFETIHARFAGQRKRGEWFDLTPGDIREIKESLK